MLKRARLCLRRAIVPAAAAIGLAAIVTLATDLAAAPDTGSNAGERTIAVPGSSVLLRTWEGIDTDGRRIPYYAISLDGEGFSAPRPTSYDLHLRAGTFDPAVQAKPQLLDDRLQAGDDTNVYIVQFITQPLPEFRAAIRDLGGDVHFFMSNHSHLVTMTPDVRAAVDALPYVRWTGTYEPGYRLESVLRDNAAESKRHFPVGIYNVMLFEPTMDAKTAVAARIEAIGGTIEKADAGKYLLRATLTDDQLFATARWDDVLFIDRWGPYETDMDKSRILSGANTLETIAGYTGAGVRGEVFDSGFNIGHVDFASRPLIEHGSTGGGSHGASTSGIVFGDGTGDPAGRGILPDGQGIVASSSTIGLTGPSRYTHSGELLQSPYFAVFQTASVGSPRVTDYTTISADTDAALFDFDIVHCQSQSNAGNQNSRPQAWAKNIISGGGVRHYDTLTRDDDCWCSGGSTGPAADGRIKPDLSHFYDDTFTVTSGGATSYTTSFGGTSGATPNVCGYTGLFIQMWADGVFGNTVVPGTVFENRPHMTTSKAAMINTASQYTFDGPPTSGQGTSGEIHRYRQGWGMPDVQRLYDLREKMLIINEDDLLTNLATASYNVSVTAGEPSLKATLVYADPPGVPASTQHRINDLTLRVVSPGGTEYWGNVGLVDSMWSSPGGAPNTIDTVENVFVQDPEGGSWTIEVIATEINQDSHVETPQLDADFALVVSGGTLGPGFALASSPGDVSVCTPDAAQFGIEVSQFEGFTTPVAMNAIGAPGGTTVSFSNDNVVPPGFTTMTVSDTDLAPEGTYVIEVTGTTAELNKSVFVTLNISTAPPTMVSLVSPADGATGTSRLPTLDWDAASQAGTYDVEISTTPGFGSIAYSATVAGTSHTVMTNLELGTEYFWRIRSDNICGTGPDSVVRGFTTIDQQDYFTEQFPSGENDLENFTLAFVPDGSGDFYSACRSDITALPTDPAGGIQIFPGDNSSLLVTLFGPPLSLYGQNYGQFYIGSNGFITFTGPDAFSEESLSHHFESPRISALLSNLDPGPEGSGTVSYKQLPDRVAVTFEDVPLNDTNILNTFQTEMFYNGEIHLSWLDVDLTTGIVGLSAGGGIPADFLATDASATPVCAGACLGDLDGSGDVGFGDVLAIIAAWGPCGACPEDLSGNGVVDFADILVAIGAWGACP